MDQLMEIHYVSTIPWGAVLQTPAGVSTYRENQTKNYTLGRAMPAHAWAAGDPPTAEATINVLLA
jgi:hypothetical protein